MWTHYHFTIHTDPMQVKLSDYFMVYGLWFMVYVINLLALKCCWPTVGGLWVSFECGCCIVFFLLSFIFWCGLLLCLVFSFWWFLGSWVLFVRNGLTCLWEDLWVLTSTGTALLYPAINTPHQLYHIFSLSVVVLLLEIQAFFILLLDFDW